MGRVQVEQRWVFSIGLRSFRVGSNFGFLLAQVISIFGSSGLGRILGHLISGSLGFWVVSGQVGPGWAEFFFCHDLFWVGLDFESSDFKTFNCSSIIFKSFKIRSGRVWGYLISGHLGFKIVQARIGSSFGSSVLGFWVIWVQIGLGFGSSNLGFRVIWVQIRLGFGSSNLGFRVIRFWVGLV
jgi:hypothetical protein